MHEERKPGRAHNHLEVWLSPQHFLKRCEDSHFCKKMFLLRTFLHQLLLVCLLLCFLLLLLLLSSIFLLAPNEESACVFSSPCVSSYRRVHFPRSVLFCQPHQQLFTHVAKERWVYRLVWARKLISLPDLAEVWVYSSSHSVWEQGVALDGLQTFGCFASKCVWRSGTGLPISLLAVLVTLAVLVALDSLAVSCSLRLLKWKGLLNVTTDSTEDMMVKQF